jgi:hypothetical protein
MIIPNRKISHTTILLAVIGIGFFLRALVAWYAFRDLSIPREEDDYIGWAQSWISTGVYPWPRKPPLYLFICALFLSFFGGDIAKVVASLVIVQVLISTFLIGVVYQLVKRIFSQNSYALAAMVWVATDPLLVLLSAFIISESIYTFLLLISIYFLFFAIYAPHWADSLRWSVLSGGVLGLASLTRSVGMVAIIPVLWLIGVSSNLNSYQRLVRGTVVGVTFSLVLAAWSWYNYKTYGHFAPSSAGPYNIAALWVGPGKSLYEGKTAEGNIEIWKEELEKLEKPRNDFELADQAASVAVEWALAHPLPTARAIVISQMKMLIAPWISQWREILALEKGSVTYKSVHLFLAGLRLASLSLLCLGFYRLMAQNALPIRTAGIFFLLLIGFHMLAGGGGANVRLVAPVAPYIDILASIGLVFLIRRLWGISLTRRLNHGLETMIDHR